MLQPRGKLLVEDFAFDAVNEPTIAWFIDVLRNQPLINAGASAFISELISSDDPAAAWAHHHTREVHSVAAMNRYIARHFNIEEASRVPYSYRYLIPTLPATLAAARFLRRVLHEETQLGPAGQVALVGRRIVGTPIQGRSRVRLSPKLMS